MSSHIHALSFNWFFYKFPQRDERRSTLLSKMTPNIQLYSVPALWGLRWTTVNHHLWSSEWVERQVQQGLENFLGCFFFWSTVSSFIQFHLLLLSSIFQLFTEQQWLPMLHGRQITSMAISVCAGVCACWFNSHTWGIHSFTFMFMNESGCRII